MFFGCNQEAMFYSLDTYFENYMSDEFEKSVSISHRDLVQGSRFRVRS
jgi:hypothetical protein